MKFYQRKYCEDCDAYFFYTHFDDPEPNEPCPVDPEHTVRDHNVLKAEGCMGFHRCTEDEQSTVQTDWQEAQTTYITPDEIFQYKIFFSAEISNATNNAVTCVRILVDGEEKILSENDCEVSGGSRLQRLISGHLIVDLTAEQHTIQVQYKCLSGTAYIRRIRLSGEMICYESGAGYGQQSS